MGLSKGNQSLLVELVKNQDRLNEFLDELYDDVSSSEETKLNARFGTLRDNGFLYVYYADDRACNVSLRPEADDYVEENALNRNELTNDILKNILTTVKKNNEIAVFMMWGVSGGNSQIAWRQVDEQEWEISIEAISSMLKVKKSFREIDNELEKYGMVPKETNEIDGYRYKKTVKYGMELLSSTEQLLSQDKIAQIPEDTELYFEKFFQDFKAACLRMQANNAVNKAIEDVKTQYIRDLLNSGNYSAQDQSQRGVSATGVLAGEVDLLINNKNMMPITMIEALNLCSIDSAEIKLHIDKITNYDTSGLQKNIILIYTYTANFDDFIRRYIRHINEVAQLKYPLINLTDISSDEYSEFRVLTSIYMRSGKKRELLHVFVSLPR